MIEAGRRLATPLLLVLILVELTDLVFAVDSIPAIFGVTRDPFIVYTSNIFAVMGLRSLYFLLAAVVDRFHLLKYGLAVILTFVGFKMLAEGWLEIDIALSLGDHRLRARHLGHRVARSGRRTGRARRADDRAGQPPERRSMRVAHVEQNLEVQLLAAIAEVERRHLRVVAAGLGSIERLFVHLVEVGENAFAGT